MAVTTELLLARHGEAACNVAGIVGGDRGCTGLTPLGRQQVEQLAARLTREHTGHPFDVVYSTPRRRVQETSEIVTRALGLPAVVEAELLGPDHGDADGRPWHEVKTAFGGPPQHNPDVPYAPGSESWTAYLDRSTRALEKILARHQGQRVLVLAHGETIEAAHTLLLGLPPGTSRRARFITDPHVSDPLAAACQPARPGRLDAGRSQRHEPPHQGPAVTTAQELLDLCRHHIDPHAEPLAQHAGHDHTSVLRAATRDGEVIVKVHRGRDKAELLAGRGDDADVAAPPGSDAFPDRADAGGRGQVCTDSTAAHRTSREPCLVIRPRCTWVSDS